MLVIVKYDDNGPSVEREFSDVIFEKFIEVSILAGWRPVIKRKNAQTCEIHMYSI